MEKPSCSSKFTISAAEINKKFCREPSQRKNKALNFDEYFNLINDDASDISDISSDEESVDEYLPPGQSKIHPRVNLEISNDQSGSELDSETENLSRESEIVPEQQTGNTLKNKYDCLKVLWKNKSFSDLFLELDDNYPDPPISLPSPKEYFKMFISDDILEMIANETNLYSGQRLGAPICTNSTEIEKVLGMYFRMGLVQMPRVRAYWECGTRFPLIADVMGRNRFESILRNIHFYDSLAATRNSSQDQTTTEHEDRCFKIRPFLDKLRENCLKFPQGSKTAIDEILIPFRGRSRLKQYMPNKPHCKWGLKVWCRASESGFCIDFDVYQGRSAGHYGDQSGYSIGLGSGVVIQLASTIPNDQEHLIIADNFFTSLNLVLELSERGLFFVGTARENRLRGCKLKTEKQMKKDGRGSIDSYVTTVGDKDVVAVKWLDNKPCVLVSNCVGVDPTTEVKRWDKRERKHVMVQCPAIIPVYNRSMGGVDLLDAFTYKYKYEIRASRWYMYLFWHLITVSAVNAWVLHRRQSKQLGIKPMQQRIFLADLAASLISTEKRRVGRLSIEEVCQDAKKRKSTTQKPTTDVRYDGVNHWPKWESIRNRCCICKNKNSYVKCEKCNMYLCFNKDRNCFKSFHVK